MAALKKHARTARTNNGNRRGTLAFAPVVLASVLLWVAGGCGGQQEDAPNERERGSAATQTANAVPETTAEQRTTAAPSPAIALQASDPIRLTDDIGYYPAVFSFSSDGDKVAFMKEFSDPYDVGLYAVNSDGTGLIHVTDSTTAGVTRPTISPSGNKIIFESDAGNLPSNTDIYSVNSDSTNLINLTESMAAGEVAPTFSPDGDQIIFVRYPICEPLKAQQNPDACAGDNIYAMSSDGSNQHRLTNDAATHVDPKFSSDGEKIILIRMNSGYSPTKDSGIYVTDSDGSNAKRLVDGVLPPTNYIFSPDGERVAFDKIAKPDPTRVEMYTVNANGTGLMRLTKNTVFDGYPAFVPGTDMLAFVSARDGDEDIYAMRLDGTGLTNLTDTNSANESAPAFSADGSKMAYSSVRRDRSDQVVSEIYVMSLDSTN